MQVGVNQPPCTFYFAFAERCDWPERQPRAQQEAQIAAQKGMQQAEIEKQRVVQSAEIDRQKAVEAAAIEKEKVVGAALIVKEQAIEVATIGKQIAVIQSLEQQARAEAAKQLALAEEEKAKQTITLVEVTAEADRNKAQQIILAEANATQQKIAAEAGAAAALKEAEAMVTIANAIAAKGTAEADARRKMVDAENALALKFVLRDIAYRAIDKLPEIAKELMEPAKAIREIKVLQTGGFSGGGSANGQPALGTMSPILKSILEAGAAYPLLRELMQFAGGDAAIGDKVKSALDELTTEIGGILKKEESVSSNGEPEVPAPRPPVDVKVVPRDDARRGVGE